MSGRKCDQSCDVIHTNMEETLSEDVFCLGIESIVRSTMTERSSEGADSLVPPGSLLL